MQKTTKNKKTLSKQLREEVTQLIKKFNHEEINSSQCYYVPRYRGPFVYLDRFAYGQQEPVARIKYTGNWDDWEFAIFKWSSETYDTEEFFFPGAECLDGSIKGALKAGMRAYPITDKSNPEGLFAELGQFLNSLLPKR